MPALPLDEAGKYVAGAYVVFCALILVYVAIMAARLQRIERELGELAERAEHTGEHRPEADPAGVESGAGQNARGVAEGKVLERAAPEQSPGGGHSRQEVL
jgi:hypothetical protein